MRMCVLVCLGLLATGRSNGERAPDPAALVRRLADDSFPVRSQAAAGLLKLGRAAEPALRAGLTHPDAEVRDRCRELLDEVVRADREERLQAFLAEDPKGAALAGWSRFSGLTGTGSAARKFFAALYRADGDLLEAAERDPKESARPFADRCTMLAASLIVGDREEAALGDVALLLLLAGDRRLTTSPSALDALNNGLEVLSNRPALRKRFLQDEPARKLLLAYLRQRTEAAPRERALALAGNIELAEAADWAVELALSREAPPGVRGWALLAAGQIGAKKHVPVLEPLLVDTTPLGQKTLGARTIRTELRDVALATVVRLGGQQPAAYGFPYFQAVPGLKAVPTPTCLGFADAAGREAALKKWKDRADTPK
jgi:hypothetical protein